MLKQALKSQVEFPWLENGTNTGNAESDSEKNPDQKIDQAGDNPKIKKGAWLELTGQDQQENQ